MEPKPLKKSLFDQASQLGVKEIQLEFWGGSDEGYLQVNILFPADKPAQGGPELDQLERAVEEWAWEVYDYSGAGDGTDYGDDITYDIQEKTVSYCEWHMERQYGGDTMTNLEVANEHS